MVVIGIISELYSLITFNRVRCGIDSVENGITPDFVTKWGMKKVPLNF